MNNITFQLSVLYSTLAVFDPQMERPFNDWTNEHVNQGFTWRPGSVSFATLDEGGPHQVTIKLGNLVALQPTTQRAILVPFQVGPSGFVEIGSIPGGQIVQLPPGLYKLLYEAGYQDDDAWCLLTFVPDPTGDVQAQVLRADKELSPTYPLCMTADPV